MMANQWNRDRNDTALLDVYSCIVDYACRHRLLDVIYEVCKHPDVHLSTLAVPHVRLASACLYKIVVSDSVSEFTTAIQLAQQLFGTVCTFSNHVLLCCYAKLLCGLKIKALFHCLQTSPKQAFVLLRTYFPRGGDYFDTQLTLCDSALAEKIKQVRQDFRKSFLCLIGRKDLRQIFMNKTYKHLYEQQFSQSLLQRVTIFLTELEKDLPNTLLDELLKEDMEENTPVSTPTWSDILMELLLDCVQGKTTLCSADLLSLLDDLHTYSASSQHDLHYRVKCMSLLSSSESQSLSNGSVHSHQSNGADADSESSVQGNKEGDRDVGICSASLVTDTDELYFANEDSVHPAAKTRHRKHRICLKYLDSSGNQFKLFV